MIMRTILLAIQCISIVGLFFESLIVFHNWKNRLQGYLFLNCLAVMINDVGYLFEMTASNRPEYLTALRLSYAGRVWIGLTLFFFVADLTRTWFPNFLRTFLVFVHAIIYCFILTIEKNTLYYTTTEYVGYGVFPRLIHGDGILHHIFMGLQCGYILIAIFWLVRSYFQEQSPRTKTSLLLVACAILVQGSFFVMQVTHAFRITGYYDITMLGYFFGTIIMLIAILRFDLLKTRELAREYVIDRISEGIIAVDDNGLLQYYNEPAARLYPGLRFNVPFRWFGTVKRRDPRQSPFLLRNEVIAEVAGASCRNENLEIGGRFFSVEQNDLLYNGKKYGKIYALVDETEHIRYMKELQEQRDIADSANAAKTRFLANMSHEIRTPINAVLGMDEMILRESREKAIRTYASDIMSAGRTLLSLINDILDLSKVEEGKMEIIPVHYELTSLVNDLVNMIHDRAAKKGLCFNIEVDSHIPHLLCGDETRIRQCVLNILTNAVKYTEEGSVKLKVSFSDPKREPEEDASGEGHHEGSINLSFSVADTGIGMKEEDLDKLFSPYERLEEKRNRSVEGTGLGMSITKQLLFLMGSELKVDSEYGKGSSFSFTIKQRVVSWEEIGDFSGRFAGSEESVRTYHELFHAPDARILVVDDTEMNLTVIKSLLKKTEIRIDTALSGEDALTLAGTNEYDVVFIDHMMPGMDGIETLRRMRKEGKNTGTPAVALTANAISGARETYISAGFTDYLSKPIDSGRLEKLLQNLIPSEKLKTGKANAAGEKSGRNDDRSVVLVVDDDSTVCGLIKTILKNDYEVRECLLGAEALMTTKKYRPDLILLDIHLPDMNGFSVMETLRQDETTSRIPVLLLTGDNDSVTEENGFRSGASDYIRKPFAPDVLKQRVRRIIELDHYQRSIEEEVRKQAGRSRRLTREMMMALSKTVDTKDHYTDGHSRRVAAICAELGRRLGKDDRTQVMLYEIGLLHDIGKIGVHDQIIRKDSGLTDDEFGEIKEHTQKGYEILKEIKDMPELSEGARWHHERYNGTGYPDGLKGEEIPETARITCVADCYDAMTSTRSYSSPRKQEEVRAEIERCRGTFFDPEIADVMLSMIDEDKEYRMNENAKPGDVWKEYDRLWENYLPAENGDITEVTLKDGEQEASGGPLPGWLLGISGLDTSAGLKNCGSAEGYISVLSVFHNTAETKAGEIEKLYSSGDTEGYTIKVHALKSSARIIGAMSLSQLAKELEDAGKAGDTDLIRENTGRLLEMYRELDGKLKELDGDSAPENLQEIDEAGLSEAWNTVVEIADSMDYEMMEGVLKDLRSYRLPEDAVRVVEKMEKLLNELDFDGIRLAAEEALKER